MIGSKVNRVETDIESDIYINEDKISNLAMVNQKCYKNKINWRPGSVFRCAGKDKPCNELGGATTKIVIMQKDRIQQIVCAGVSRKDSKDNEELVPLNSRG